MRNDLSNTCQRVLYNNVKKPKKKYKTDEHAILVCMKINSQEKQIHKVTAYRCDTCGEYHIGKTKKVLSKKDKESAKQWLRFN